MAEGAIRAVANMKAEVLNRLQTAVGIQHGAITGMQTGAVRLQAKLAATANVLEKCKEIGVIRDGAVNRNLRTISFSNDMLNALETIKGIDLPTLKKIVGIDISSLERIVGFDASNLDTITGINVPELQSLVDVSSNTVYGARVLEELKSFFPQLQSMFKVVTVQLFSGGTCIVFFSLLFNGMTGEQKVLICGILLIFIGLVAAAVVVCGNRYLCNSQQQGNADLVELNANPPPPYSARSIDKVDDASIIPRKLENVILGKFESHLIQWVLIILPSRL
jgi:hypothetical protein